MIFPLVVTDSHLEEQAKMGRMSAWYAEACQLMPEVAELMVFSQTIVIYLIALETKRFVGSFHPYKPYIYVLRNWTPKG